MEAKVVLDSTTMPKLGLGRRPQSTTGVSGKYSKRGEGGREEGGKEGGRKG